MVLAVVLTPQSSSNFLLEVISQHGLDLDGGTSVFIKSSY